MKHEALMRSKVNNEEEIFEPTEEKEPALRLKPSERRVYAEKKDFPISYLYGLWKGGDLDLQPGFQRRHVWKDKTGSLLIESIWLEIPIPMIYISEERDGKWIVIDGQQRLTWLFRFLDNKFALRGLRILKESNRKKFKDLPKVMQHKLKNASLRVIELGMNSHPDVKFEIFERINTGAVPLNAQEIRNCIYRGPFNNLIEELASKKDFLGLLGLDKIHNRMGDCEIALRFFAFYHTNYEQYRGNMRRFLSSEMEQWRFINNDEADKIRKVFRKSVQLSKTVFGDFAFRRFSLGSEIDPNGQWEQRVNNALFDIVMYGFTLYEKRDVVPRSDAIREELLWLMTQDEEFYWSIAKSTDNPKNVKIHFRKWLNSLNTLVGIPSKEPRSFSSSLKKSLWEQNSTCKLCGQEIMLVDDAVIDHVEHYWRGGKTIPKNARLTHRFCNAQRGGRD